MRGDLLDIKVKTGQTPEGYEIFQPRGKFPFPVKREELAGVLSELKVGAFFSAVTADPTDKAVLHQFRTAGKCLLRNGRRGLDYSDDEHAGGYGSSSWRIHFNYYRWLLAGAEAG